ncbi:heterokaryon incompatibility protein [Colletotrichum chrysophilum]|uniref:Heterokaryon incompatibility protein n=1 Tax=Colletotrichum chrysophilum TaxID=1836956 RepID=A0AAD9ASQ9_9PEZI|nr:heterokaryon incompatibility protein [Colletotrichum chrysophilum]
MSLSLGSPFAGLQLDHDASFRLLELQPGRRDDPISIRLLSFDLEGAPSYEALSYAWGDPSETEPISVISGASEMTLDTQFHATKSCAAALRRLRSAEVPRMLWIDAICINQSDIPERNHQLNLITRIYRTASRVVIYLGEKSDEDDSDAIMDWVQALHALSHTGKRPKRPDGERIERFLRRSWFTRVWVMQEIRVAMAAVVVCGEKEVDWDAFRQLRYTFYNPRRSKWLPYTVQALISGGFDSYSWRPSYPVRLLRLLERTREFDATDSRDKLFAILPLLDWDSQQYLDANPEARISNHEESAFDIGGVDYGRPAAEVFTQLSRQLIDAIGLDVLQTVITPTRISGLPSWATDWSITDVYLYNGPFWKGPERFVDIERERDHASPSTWSFSKYVGFSGLESIELRVLGGLAGTILRLGELCDVAENIFPLEQWRRMCNQAHLKTPETYVGLSLFAEAIVEDPQRRKAANVYSVLDEIQAFNSQNLPGDVESPAAMDFSASDNRTGRTCGSSETWQIRNLCEYTSPSFRFEAEAIFGRCHGRRLFITDTGLLGLAPKSTQVGDQVLGLAGYDVPFVVRPAESPSNVFQLVGCCSSQGFLDLLGKYEDIILR